MSISPPSAVVAAPAVPTTSRRRRRVPIKARVGLGIIGLFVLIAIAAPLLAPHDPLTGDPVRSLEPPSIHHLLGTDELGRDELSRLIYAARVDLPVALLAVLFPALLGTLLGAVAGFVGGWIDAIVMRISDLVQAFPIYILMIALVFALGPGVRSVLVAFTALGWVVYARLLRSEIVRVRELDYVAAARAAGLSAPRVLGVHVLPNTIGQTLIYVTSDLVFAMLAFASFSFLGLGIPPPTAEWGAMIAAGEPYVGIAWWLTVLPGLTIALIALGLALIGDSVQDRFRR